jgi:cytochrome c-type biogenesis protein CcmH/NrfG
LNLEVGTWKLVAFAAVLAVGTWMLSSSLLSVKLPADFPKLPDTGMMSPAVRSLLVSADRDARKHPADAEAVGKLGMAYHANDYFEQALAAYRIARPSGSQRPSVGLLPGIAARGAGKRKGAIRSVERGRGSPARSCSRPPEVG